MLIVAGAFVLAPEERDEFVAGRVESIVATRTEPGCLEYAMSVDPADPSRVLLFERWADQAAFDAHMVVVKGAQKRSGPVPTGMSVEIYDICGTRSFG